MRAFVTGGSGFIGGVLIKRLVGEGVQVRALARSESSADKVRKLGAEPFMGDLNPVGNMSEGAAGCDVAYHAAAFVEQWGPWSEFQAATVDGTANALAACRTGGVERFVHVGTEAALVDGNALVNADETWPLKPDSRAYYPRSKARAEQAVVAANGVGGMETLVVRPRFVWGPGDTTLLPAIVELIRAGKFAWVGGGGHLTSTAHVDNVVEGLVLAAEKGRGGEAYFITDGDPLPFRAPYHASCRMELRAGVHGERGQGTEAARLRAGHLARGRPRRAEPSDLDPRRTEAGGAADGPVQRLDLLQLPGLVAHHHELGDAVAHRHLERLRPVGVQQQHPHLASIARVDQPGRVDQRYAVAQREAGARQHEAGTAGRDGHGQPGADRGPLPRAQRERLGCPQVIAGVVGVRALGRHGVRGEAREAQRHGAEPLGETPFTAKRSNRAAADAGTRARTLTPSAVSSRSISPARSCSSESLPPSS